MVHALREEEEEQIPQRDNEHREHFRVGEAPLDLLFFPMMPTGALGGASCNHPHIAEKKTEAPKGQDTCLPSTGFPNGQDIRKGDYV